jgi:hypothetical protein
MSVDVRKCSSGSEFNTGKSKCPIPRGKIKALIFVEPGVKLPLAITAESIEKAIHADVPNRIYPISIVDEYAPTGGDANVSQQGYGPNKVSGYAAKTDAFTIDNYDMHVRANIVGIKNKKMDVYFVNDSNFIFGEQDIDGSLKGIPLSGVYFSGQDFDSSGQVAQMILNVMYSDIEKHWILEDAKVVDFDITSILNGLVTVEVKSVTSPANGYKLIEKIGGLDVTPYYGQNIATKASDVLDGAPTGVTYNNGVIVASSAIKLAKPSVLQEYGIVGIEQYGTVI